MIIIINKAVYDIGNQVNYFVHEQVNQPIYSPALTMAIIRNINVGEIESLVEHLLLV